MSSNESPTKVTKSATMQNLNNIEETQEVSILSQTQKQEAFYRFLNGMGYNGNVEDTIERYKHVPVFQHKIPLLQMKFSQICDLVEEYFGENQKTCNAVLQEISSDFTQSSDNTELKVSHEEKIVSCSINMKPILFKQLDEKKPEVALTFIRKALEIIYKSRSINDQDVGKSLRILAILQNGRIEFNYKYGKILLTESELNIPTKEEKKQLSAAKESIKTLTAKSKQLQKTCKKSDELNQAQKKLKTANDALEKKYQELSAQITEKQEAAAAKRAEIAKNLLNYPLKNQNGNKQLEDKDPNFRERPFSLQERISLQNNLIIRELKKEITERKRKLVQYRIEMIQVKNNLIKSLEAKPKDLIKSHIKKLEEDGDILSYNHLYVEYHDTFQQHVTYANFLEQLEIQLKRITAEKNKKTIDPDILYKIYNQTEKKETKKLINQLYTLVNHDENDETELLDIILEHLKENEKNGNLTTKALSIYIDNLFDDNGKFGKFWKEKSRQYTMTVNSKNLVKEEKNSEYVKKIKQAYETLSKIEKEQEHIERQHKLLKNPINLEEINNYDIDPDSQKLMSTALRLNDHVTLITYIQDNTLIISHPSLPLPPQTEALNKCLLEIKEAQKVIEGWEQNRSERKKGTLLYYLNNLFQIDPEFAGEFSLKTTIKKIEQENYGNLFSEFNMHYLDNFNTDYDDTADIKLSDFGVWNIEGTFVLSALPQGTILAEVERIKNKLNNVLVNNYDITVPNDILRQQVIFERKKVSEMQEQCQSNHTELTKMRKALKDTKQAIQKKKENIPSTTPIQSTTLIHRSQDKAPISFTRKKSKTS